MLNAVEFAKSQIVLVLSARIKKVLLCKEWVICFPFKYLKPSEFSFLLLCFQFFIAAVSRR